MALVAAGVTASWGSTALGEVTELKWTLGGGLPQSRGSTVAGSLPWSLDIGTVEVSYLAGTAATTIAGEWGKKAVLSIGGSCKNTATATPTVVTFTTKAICQTLDIGAKVNDVWRYKGTFKIVQE
jgi:hypothetical protein